MASLNTHVTSRSVLSFTPFKAEIIYFSGAGWDGELVDTVTTTLGYVHSGFGSVRYIGSSYHYVVTGFDAASKVVTLQTPSDGGAGTISNGFILLIGY